jgi:hypothetical protein
MCYNSSPGRPGGAALPGCAAAAVRLNWVSKQLRDIALRGPRDFGFAAWVMKTAKAPVPASTPAQPGFVVLASTTRASFGASIRPRSESVMYWVSRSTARGADRLWLQAEAASGTEYPSPPAHAM